MIDWYRIAVHALWIVGSAIALSVLSFACWEKDAKGERLSLLLSQSHRVVHLNSAALLFCLGMAGTSRSNWEIVLWCILVGWYVYKTWTAIRSYRKEQV